MHHLKTNSNKILKVPKSILQNDIDTLGIFTKIVKRSKSSDIEVIS